MLDRNPAGIVKLAAEINRGMTPAPAPELDDVAANLARLEGALERIAQASAAVQAAPPNDTPRLNVSGASPAVSVMVADRLDSMIARLREAISQGQGD